jgi:hypothetical protein
VQVPETYCLGPQLLGHCRQTDIVLRQTVQTDSAAVHGGQTHMTSRHNTQVDDSVDELHTYIHPCKRTYTQRHTCTDVKILQICLVNKRKCTRAQSLRTGPSSQESLIMHIRLHTPSYVYMYAQYDAKVQNMNMPFLRLPLYTGMHRCCRCRHIGLAYTTPNRSNLCTEREHHGVLGCEHGNACQYSGLRGV